MHKGLKVSNIESRKRIFQTITIPDFKVLHSYEYQAQGRNIELWTRLVGLNPSLIVVELHGIDRQLMYKELLNESVPKLPFEFRVFE